MHPPQCPALGLQRIGLVEESGKFLQLTAPPCGWLTSVLRRSRTKARRGRPNRTQITSPEPADARSVNSRQCAMIRTEPLGVEIPKNDRTRCSIQFPLAAGTPSERN